MEETLRISDSSTTETKQSKQKKSQPMTPRPTLRVGAVEWCSVGRHNFAAEVARLCALLRRDAPRLVAFVALDGEFSGPSWSSAVDADHGAWQVPSSTAAAPEAQAKVRRGAGIWDANLARRFAALCEATHANALLQLGLALYLDDGDGGYAVEAFNFSLLPRRDFGVSASSMAFLARNGIDLNAHFRSAVPLWLAPPPPPPPGTERSAASAAAPRVPPPDAPPPSALLTADEKRVLRNRRSKERKRKRKRAQLPSQPGSINAAVELAAAAAAAAELRKQEQKSADTSARNDARRTQSAKRNTKKRRRKSSGAGASAAARPAAPPAPSARVMLASALRLVGARVPLVVHNGLADLLFVARTFDLCCTVAAGQRACETTPAAAAAAAVPACTVAAGQRACETMPAAAAAAAAPAPALEAKEGTKRAAEVHLSSPPRATLPRTIEEWVGETHALWGGADRGVFDTKFMAASLDRGCHATWLKYVYTRAERVHGGGGGGAAARTPRGGGAEHPPPCHQFAQCGACSRIKRGRTCDYDHDLERLLSSEEARDHRSRARRRRKRAPPAAAAAEASAGASPAAAAAPRPQPLLLQHDDWHTAAHDAVATGFIFASFLQRFGGASDASSAAAVRRNIPGFVPECVDDCRNRVHLMRRQRPGAEDAALVPLVLRPQS